MFVIDADVESLGTVNLMQGAAEIESGVEIGSGL